MLKCLLYCGESVFVAQDLLVCRCKLHVEMFFVVFNNTAVHLQDELRNSDSFDGFK